MVPSLSDFGAMWKASGLKEKLTMTILLVIVYRLGAQIPIWGVNHQALLNIPGNPLIQIVDMFSGGALSAVSILALGIGPYITASIIMQLLTVVIPRLEEMQKEEGEAGRRKLSQITRYATVVLGLIQGFLVIQFILNLHPQGQSAVNLGLMAGVDPTVFMVLGVLSLTAGALFSLWLAEMITERGIGNGASILILVGILSRLPSLAGTTGDLVASNPQKSFALVVLLLIYLGLIGLIIVLQQSERRVFVVSAKRQVGNKIYGGQSTHIPFKINPAGVMPIIFAFAVISFPYYIINTLKSAYPAGLTLEDIFGWGLTFKPLAFYDKWFSAGSIGYNLVEFFLIVFFTFFYASIIPSMQPREIAENLKKYGSSIPGIKPGRPTAEKLEEILSKTTFIGAVALASIALVGGLATTWTGITTLQGLGTTSLLIMVGVALDTANQIRVHLLARQYEGFLK
jgi:preprotein translocase subunit SecY